MKKLLIGVAVFLVGVLVGVGVAYSNWVKPINGQMAKINENRLETQIGRLDMIESNDLAGVKNALNADIDRSLASVYAWSTFKLPPSEKAKAAIARLLILRANSKTPHEVDPEIKEKVEKAFKLLTAEEEPQSRKTF
ncbi:MAG: hypothetical protein LBG61_04100 [Burkholderiales bacterium]|jgi:hypothetical protein|nr:hypothetical protein [Burkholderiales bacterium]